jgi:hypothetical protein
MKRLFSAKPFVAAAIAFGALGAASAAHARSDVFFSIGVQAPGVYGYAEPAPVYVEPRPVYVEPQPVYVQPRPVYVQPQPVYYGRGWDDRATVVYERDHRRHWRHDHRHGPYGDWDNDGVPNRFDRAPGNPYRR